MSQPEGDTAPAPPLRYVVLRHDGIPEPHFDLMFETSPGSALAAWRSPAWPVEPTTPLTPLPDHRAEYLTYEGPVSRGRGEVRRAVAGTHRVIGASADTVLVELNAGTVLRLPRVVAAPP